ncbi:hypothetical protein RHSIM_Rhsim09G0064000 [Rhododendron simsii]|uniref:Uncharacterized protein n=1 Tax=Rhododendron simsii TaxID=118357 RepID=A0A834GIW0_RHOSS|nr:hypothetical protein RHSIM_Rhsim09G0064000 [Rhododendron simsii]
MERSPKSEMEGIVNIDGMNWKLGRKELHNVFKGRGHVSNWVMAIMMEWLMMVEKSAAARKDGHENLLNYDKLGNQNVLDDPVNPEMVGYEVATCGVIDKVIEALDSSPLDCPEKKTTIATEESTFSKSR